MLSQEQLQSVELLGDTLDVIQSVDADDKLNTVESLLELMNPFLNRLFGEVLDA